ncbi:MAG: phage holin family protein [Gammaproteobacteria bacterium]|nr:phage holin family protein [Gammaproteobacteria bacterium]MBU1644713.1 phage holin family protein [Gammaproteobacteria bacterium]MBU1973527.1 phage holin family protein [Gammaproteobacteria bacterium]
MAETAPRGGLAASLRSLLGNGLGLLQTRLELLSVEAQEEKAHLFALLGFGAAAFVLLSFGLMFLAVLVTVLLWESHRLLALAAFTAVFLTGGLVALVIALRLSRRPPKLFAASIAELVQDRAALQPKTHL